MWYSTVGDQSISSHFSFQDELCNLSTYNNHAFQLNVPGQVSGQNTKDRMLHISALFGHIGLASLLILIGANVNSQLDRFHGKTPLMVAAQHGHLEMVKLLLDSGALPNLKSKIGFSALIYSICSGNSEIVKLLIDKSASVNQPENKGFTPVMIALLLGKVGLAEILVDHGADLGIYNSKHENALILSASFNQLNSVKFILYSNRDYGNINDCAIYSSSSTNCTNINVFNALDFAINNNNHEMVSLLKAHGALPFCFVNTSISDASSTSFSECVLFCDQL